MTGSRLFLLLTSPALLGLACSPPVPPPAYQVTEASIPDLQAAMADGTVSSADLVDLYLARIEAYDEAGPRLNTIIRLNREREAGRIRGPMHGIPVLMKDNYDVAGMATTGSSMALAGMLPVDDAFQVARLRDAGAVVIGKTNLHELAAGITTISSLGGQTRNPYDPARNPGGSSGGTGAAVAASFASVGWGSDTCGSIRIPSSVHSLFGLRPTKGLSSIDGILPLSHSQDTGGPLARTATDLAVALDATVGPDEADPATAIWAGASLPSFQEALDPGALAGTRVGALTQWLAESGLEAPITEVVRAALEEMAAAGATVVDVAVPDLDSLLSDTGLIDFEFKFDLMEYLSAVPGAPVRSLGEILDAGLHHEALDGTFRRRNEREAADSDEYRETLARRERLRNAVLAFMDAEGLDALAYPTMRRETALIGQPATGSTCFLSAHTGLPALSLPAGFTEEELPVGLELLGRPMDDYRLVAMAYAFETLGPKRRPPIRTPPLVDGAPPLPVSLAIRARDPDAGPRLTGSMELSVPESRLRWDLAVSIDDPELAYATALRRLGDDGGGVVVLLLSGPGEVRPSGSAELTPRLLGDLLGGRLELLVHTASGYEHLDVAPADGGAGADSGR